MIFFHFLVWFLLVLMLANVLANLTVFGRMRRVEPPAEGPLVSILLPIRDEERNIEECVRALMKQDYPRYELIILDDDSSDASAEIAEGLLQELRDPRISARVIRGEALPEGWVGKNWACHQLAEAASGDFLFFTDASVIHEPGTIASAVDHACAKNAGLVSAWPQQITVGWAERLTAPLQYVATLAFFPIWLQRLIQSRRDSSDSSLTRLFALANGQFLFFTRECYYAVGGHAAVRSHMAAELALAREIMVRAANGLRLVHCDALRFSTVRMERSFGEARDGYSRHMRAIFDRHAVLFWIAVVIQIACLIGPFYLLFATGLVFPVAALFGIRAILAARFRSDWVSVLCHPAGAALLLLFQFDNWLRTVTKGMTWKGRQYPAYFRLHSAKLVQ